MPFEDMGILRNIPGITIFELTSGDIVKKVVKALTKKK
jgi:transketolase C-terminal domain/subunit